MANRAKASQSKSDNLNCCAYSARKVNGRVVAFKIWSAAWGSVRANIAISKLPEVIAQIDAALASDERCITLDGAIFTANETLLREIRADFASLVSSNPRGGNDAHVPACCAAKRRGQHQTPKSVRARTETGASISFHKNDGGVSHTSLPRLSAPNAESSNLNNPPKNSGGGRASNRAGKGSPAAPAAQRVFARGRRTSVAVNP